MARGTKKVYKGVTFASSYEADLAKRFDDEGIIWEYEPIRIAWQPDVCYYKPDFRLTYPDGIQKIVEVKGHFRQKDRVLLKKIKEQHPDIDISLWFQRPNNKLHSKSSTTYKDWAEKHGFKIM